MPGIIFFFLLTQSIRHTIFSLRACFVICAFISCINYVQNSRNELVCQAFIKYIVHASLFIFYQCLKYRYIYKYMYIYISKYIKSVAFFAISCLYVQWCTFCGRVTYCNKLGGRWLEGSREALVGGCEHQERKIINGYLTVIRPTHTQPRERITKSIDLFTWSAFLRDDLTRIARDTSGETEGNRK